MPLEARCEAARMVKASMALLLCGLCHMAVAVRPVPMWAGIWLVMQWRVLIQLLHRRA